MSRRSRSPLTAAEIRGILDDRAAGVPITTIAKTHNVATSTIYGYEKAASRVALEGGRWVINTRTRVLEYVLDCDQVAS